MQKGQIIGFWWKQKEILNNDDSNNVNDKGYTSKQLIEEIRLKMLEIKSNNMNNDGSLVSYNNIKTSENFNNYIELVKQLKYLNLNQLNDDEKKSCFINIYNCLIIHSIINNLLDINGGTIARLKLYATASYNIGGYLFSLNDIENGLLRCNRKSAVPLTRTPFSNDDERKKFMVSSCDGR